MPARSAHPSVLTPKALSGYKGSEGGGPLGGEGATIMNPKLKAMDASTTVAGKVLTMPVSTKA